MCHYALELQECIAELSVVLFEEESSEVARQVLWCTRSNIKGVCYSKSRYDQAERTRKTKVREKCKDLSD